MKKNVLKQLLIGLALSLSANGLVKAQCSVTASSDTTVCSYGSVVQLNASSGTTPLTYSWSPALGLSNASISNPQAT